MVKSEMPNAVVLAIATALTPFTATRSGQKLSGVRMNDDLWWWNADSAGGDSAVGGGEKSRLQRLVLDLVKADMGRGNGRGKGKMAGCIRAPEK